MRERIAIARKKAQTTCITYPWSRTVNDKDSFARVINEGTIEYEHLGLSSIEGRIGFQDLCNSMLNSSCEEDKARGNIQRNIFFSGGENIGRGEEELRCHYGCAMPQVNNGSEEWAYLGVELSNVARLLGIPWAVEPGCQETDMKERWVNFAGRMHKSNIFEGITIALLELFPSAAMVKEHVDGLNCPRYTHTLLFSKIVCINGALYRVCVIAYMRKSCGDAMVRRNACKEVALNTINYLRSTPNGYLPQSNPLNLRDYYKTLGSRGVGVQVSRDTSGRIIVRGACLLDHPHLDKPMAYIGPLSSLILAIYEKNRHMTMRDLVSMCLPLGHLSSTFALGIVLTSLLEREEVNNKGPLGPLAEIIESLICLNGSYSAGGFPRCQVFWNKTQIHVSSTADEISAVLNYCALSRENPGPGVSYHTYCRQKFTDTIRFLTKEVKNVGEFGAHHLAHCLVHVGILKPEGMVHCAKFASQTSTLKATKAVEETPNPAMITYLGDAPKSTRGEKARRIMESVVPHLKWLGYSYINDSVLEQVNCESYRKKEAVDCFFPGSRHMHLGRDGMHQVWPGRSQSGAIIPFLTLRKVAEARSSPTSSGAMAAGDTTNDSFLLNPYISTSNGQQDESCSCRIPREYIDAFEGMWEHIHGLFIDGTMAATCKCIEDDRRMVELIEYFVKYPSKTAAARPRGRKTPSEVAQTILFKIGKKNDRNHITQRRTPKSRELPILGPPDSGPDTLDTLLWGRQVHDIETTSAITTKSEIKFTRKDCKPCSGMNVTSTDPLKELPESINVFSQPEIPPVISLPSALQGTVAAPISLKEEDYFRHYQFPNFEQCKRVLSSSFGSISSVRQLQSSCKYNFLISPYLSEVKRSIFMGTPDDEIPVKLNKSTLVNIKCTSEKYDWLSSNNTRQANATLHMVVWSECPTLQYFTIGKCALNDKVAEALGGIPAISLDTPGLSNWLFPSCERAKKHLYFMLFITAGTPHYFQALFRRVQKTIRRSGKINGYQESTVVRIHSQAKDLGQGSTFFHIIAESRKRENGTVDTTWAIALSPEASHFDSSMKGLVILDPHTWKEASKMMKHSGLDRDPAMLRGRSSKKRKLNSDALLLQSAII